MVFSINGSFHMKKAIAEKSHTKFLQCILQRTAVVACRTLWVPIFIVYAFAPLFHIRQKGKRRLFPLSMLKARGRHWWEISVVQRGMRQKPSEVTRNVPSNMTKSFPNPREQFDKSPQVLRFTWKCVAVIFSPITKGSASSCGGRSWVKVVSKRF